MAEREFMAHWLAGSMSAGEHIVADLRGLTGPSRLWDMAALILLSMPGDITVWHDHFDAAAGGRPSLAMVVLLPAAALGVTLASIALRRTIYVAVTERQIIVVRMRGRSVPGHVLLAAPIGALRLTTTGQLGQRTITCTATDGGALLIGAKDRARFRFTAFGRRSRFDDVLGAIRAQGGSVDPPPLPPVPALDRPA